MATVARRDSDPNDPLNTYMSLDGLTTYVLSGTDLIVNGVLTVNADFQSGQFGIQLNDLSHIRQTLGCRLAPLLSSLPVGRNRISFVQVPSIAGPVAAFGNGGNDLVLSGGSLSGGNLSDGGPGDDLVGAGSALQDYSSAGTAMIICTRTPADDVALGGNGNDVVYRLSINDFATVTRNPGQ